MLDIWIMFWVIGDNYCLLENEQVATAYTYYDEYRDST